MTHYLNPDEVAERLGVKRKTAMSLMMQMNQIPISGTVRKRYRVSEDSLERWMAQRAIGKPATSKANHGSSKKLTRR